MPLTDDQRREQAARALGMLTSEVREVGEFRDDLGGYTATLADGTRALVADNGIVTVHQVTPLQLSPAAHSLNPMVRFSDLTAVFGPAVVRGTNPAELVDEFRELVDELDDEDPDEVEEPPAPPVPVEPPPVVEAESVEVPDASAAVVLAWVNADPGRARLALDAEGERAQGPRAGLTRDLNEVIAGGAEE